MGIQSVIISTGSYLPERILTNEDLSKMVDTSDEWITQRTGIRQRHIAVEGQTTSDMATLSAKEALTKAGLDASDIDGIIVATTTPDLTFPSTAALVQDKLDLRSGFAFDVQAVCSGFVYGLSVADSMIKAGTAKRMLLIGAEKMSSILDWDDRATCVLFGDGAGAVILEAQEVEEGSEVGILSTHIRSDGSKHELLCTSGGPSKNAQTGVLLMQGREVFKYAVQHLSQIVDTVLEHHQIQPDVIDWIVPHQANLRIIESTAKKINMSMDQVVVTLPEHGNTSAASIPLAFDKAVSDGRIQKGQMVLMEAMGGGFTWGAALLRF